MGTFGSYTGCIDIPEDKGEEFARQVVKLLNYGGMMQFETISMYGHDMALLKPIELYPGGKVNFHFNYFEDDAWETAGFDAAQKKFYSGKIGGQEFADVVTAVHFLYEVWDDKPGVAEIDGESVNDCEYVGWINQVLGTRFSLNKRFRLWDIAEAYALERLEYHSDLRFEDVMRFIPRGLCYGAGGVEFSDLMYITNGTESLTDAEIKSGTYPADVYGCKRALEIFLEKHTTEQAVERIWTLIRKKRRERKEAGNAALSDIANYSLILPARVIVYLTAELKEKSFWECWKEVRENVYHDEIMKEYASRELQEERSRLANAPIPPVRTSKFLCQNGWLTFCDTPEELKGKPNYYLSDDDRLYWWDGTEEVILSKEVDEWLKNLALDYKEITQNMDGWMENKDGFLKEFLMLFVEIDQYYKRIYPFQSMFYEFLQNGSQIEYRAALRLLKKISDENREAGKVIEKAKYNWGITSRNVTHNIGRLQLKRYLSVMANHKLREKYFGF
ncbi:MAG: hypothetical protein NC393_02625 [Clostridium sp.]|nr:hypothetical protein [Clostridium sp.]MCM1171000.1 hypothetical protein [Clostridium sp.]MCM1208022.1 hypothetical protein [Ruminococcus sp.]